jgi:alpha-tubulin suppressor-like RCC1 family protein
MKLLEDGVTYAIGDGSKGQLGLGQDILKAKYPKRIKALDNFVIVRISSGINIF